MNPDDLSCALLGGASAMDPLAGCGGCSCGLSCGGSCGDTQDMRDGDDGFVLIDRDNIRYLDPPSLGFDVIVDLRDDLSIRDGRFVERGTYGEAAERFDTDMRISDRIFAGLPDFLQIGRFN